jgi:hypothetical protein
LFGPRAFGLGGVFVEIFEDVVQPPFDRPRRAA